MAHLCYCMDRHPFYAVGGANRQMDLLARQFGSIHRVSYTCRRPDQREQHDWPQMESSESRIRTYSEEYSASGPEQRATLFERRYSALLEQIDADIYHARATIPNFPVAHRFLARSSRRKKLVFTAAHWFDCTLEHLRPGQRQQYMNAIGGADIVTSLSQEMTEEISTRYQREVLHIPSGHPIPSHVPPKDDPPFVVWLGRLNADFKRPELFVELAQRLTDLPARFVMIGPGQSYPIGQPGAVGERMVAAAMRVANLTYIPGILPGQDNDWIARASMLVNTSSHEGFPNTFQQAWLRHTPVASLKVDPDRVIQKHGLGVCTEGDLQQLVDTIARWTTDRQERCRTGERCRAYAERHHDIRRTADRFASVYRRLLS